MNDNKKPLSGAEKLELLRGRKKKLEQLIPISKRVRNFGWNAKLNLIMAIKKKMSHFYRLDMRERLGLDMREHLGLDMRERLGFDMRERLGLDMRERLGLDMRERLGLDTRINYAKAYNNFLLVFHESIECTRKYEYLKEAARIHRAERRYKIEKKKLKKKIFNTNKSEKRKKWKRKYKELLKEIETEGQIVECVCSIINKGKSKGNKNTLNSQFDDKEKDIKTLCEGMKPFIKADLGSWKNLFSEKIQSFEKPIQLNCSNRVLGYFLEKLRNEGFIYNGKNGKMFEDLKAFKSAKGNILTQTQINSAKKGVLKMGRNTRDERNLIDSLIDLIGGGV